MLGAHRVRYAGKPVLVVGSGHSAFNALLDLTELAAQVADTRITWAIRRRQLGQLFGGGANDLLPARGELGIRLRQTVALLCSGLAAVAVGRWLHRHGPRADDAGRLHWRAAACGLALVQQLWVFYLMMAGIGTVMAVLYAPAFAVVTTWFPQQRGQALAVLTFFGAWDSVLFIPLPSKVETSL